jgi:LuxR family maltose regulon positive regulatory protein
MKCSIVSRPALFERLDQAGRITQVSAPAGSGKTVLLRSWIKDSGLAQHAAQVTVQSDEREPQQFWVSVTNALRATAPGAELVRPLTAAPKIDGWAVVERLLEDLSGLCEKLWLVIDDLHELASPDALGQLELLVMRAPEELRIVLLSRRDTRLRLHRLRLEGEMTEVRAADLRFTLEDARHLFEAAGVRLSESALALLYDRTEGWAAGLRLAALSLTGHPDPERFAREFCGSERSVADYLLVEVLERQPAEVRRLLLRTSVLERVNGTLADLLTGGSGGERILQDLEKAGAFVVSIDTRQSWFRYHPLFAELLQRELRYTEPDQPVVLHAAAAHWHAEHGDPVEAVRHAQAAREWDLATRLLWDHWVYLLLAGKAATGRRLLAAFPGGDTTNPELTALMAAGALSRGSLEEAQNGLALAASQAESVPAARRGHFHVMLIVLRLTAAQWLGDVPAVAEEADSLLTVVETAQAASWGLTGDLRALALASLGIAEAWALRFEQANRHLAQGVVLARQIGRPYLELNALAHQAETALFQSYTWAARTSRQVIELADQHGWNEDPITAVAYTILAGTLIAQGRTEAVEQWFAKAERALSTYPAPIVDAYLHYARGMYGLARGEDEKALGDFRLAEQAAGALNLPYAFAVPMRVHQLQARVRLGEDELVKKTLDDLDARERDGGPMRTVRAMLHLARKEPDEAREVVAPLIDGSAEGARPSWTVFGLCLEAIACERLGRHADADAGVARALRAAEPDRILIAFQLFPMKQLVERHARNSSTHAALVADILDLLRGDEGGAPEPSAATAGERQAVTPAGAAVPRPRIAEPLSQSEIRILRYLPTNLSAPEIASELSLSVNTIRTHMRHLYEKLGAHRRLEAVETARALGLLAPSSRGR